MHYLKEEYGAGGGGVGWGTGFRLFKDLIKVRLVLPSPHHLCLHLSSSFSRLYHTTPLTIFVISQIKQKVHRIDKHVDV